MNYFSSIRLTSITLFTSLLFCLYPYGTSNGQANERDTRISISPCGNPNTQLENLTGFFQYRWKATYVDLEEIARDRWVKHHGFENRDIALVRLFYSPFQPTVGVVAARRFQNFLDGKLLVDVFCIIPAENNSMVRQYQPKDLEKILLGPGADT